MKNFGLIGKKLNHSISPFLHGEIARIYKNNLAYQIFEIPEAVFFKKATNLLKEDKINGFNITIPYKEEVIPYLDTLSDIAKSIGAVNTIYIKDQNIIGENTDYYGLLELIRLNEIEVKDKNVIILGTGGAAKCAYRVISDLSGHATYVTRDKNNTNISEKVITYNDLDKVEYEIIINATPIGMYPNVDESPLSFDLVEGKTVIDLIYNPQKTKLMTYGGKSVNGIEMLIIQAIYAQNLWFNKSNEIQKEVIEELKELCNEYIRNTF